MSKKDFNVDTLMAGAHKMRSRMGDTLDSMGARRRTALKLAFFGGGAFILGKIFGPSFNMPDVVSWVTGKSHAFKNFRVVEGRAGLGFYDRMGNEILLLERDPDAGK